MTYEPSKSTNFLYKLSKIQEEERSKMDIKNDLISPPEMWIVSILFIFRLALGSLSFHIKECNY